MTKRKQLSASAKQVLLELLAPLKSLNAVIELFR